MAKTVKPVQRIKKRELKEDKFVTSVLQAREYLEQNRKNIIKIAGASVLVVALVVAWVMSKSRAEYQASYELGIVLTSAQQADPASIAEDFSRIAERFSGTSAANEALLYTAQMKFMAEQTEEALEAYETYLKKGHKDRYLYPSALVGKAACLEDLRRFAEAAAAYLEAATANRDFFIAPKFHLDAARCFRLAGELDKAREQCDFIRAHYPDTDFVQEAEKESKRI